MPAWIPIVLLDLNDARVGELIAAFREEELAQGQSDPMPRLIQMVVDEMRRCIGYCASTPLDADTTAIPAGLKEMGVQKVVRLLKGRLGSKLTDDEKEAEKLYQKRLEQLTRCEWPVDKPETPIVDTPVQPKSGVEQVSGDCRRFTREKMAGL